MDIEKNYFKVFNIWLISLGVFDLLFIIYIVIMGRFVGELNIPEIILNSILGIIVLSGVAGITSIIYSIVKKDYYKILVGVGIILSTGLLFLIAVVVAISQIY